jgi:hypothetical protein
MTPERIAGIFLFKFFFQLLMNIAKNIKTVLVRITETIIHKMGISKNGKPTPTAPSSKLDKTPIANNTQNDEIFFFIHLDDSSSNASLIIHTPTPQKTIRTTQALMEAIHSKIAKPTNQPSRGNNAVDKEKANAILLALVICFLNVSLGISMLKAKARAKSSKDSPNDNKIRVK